MTYIPLPTATGPVADDALAVVVRPVGGFTVTAGAGKSLVVNQSGHFYRHINTQFPTLVKLGAGTLVRLVINAPTNTSITIYDSTTNSGTVIAAIAPGIGTRPFVLEYGIDFVSGLVIDTNGAPDLTVVYD